MTTLARRFPRAFIDRYSAIIPDFDDFLSAMQRPLRRTFRVNTLKVSPGRALELLADLAPLLGFAAAGGTSAVVPALALGLSLLVGLGLARRRRT